MGNSDHFGLCINHGGNLMSIGKRQCYVGGSFVRKYGLDRDRFGYLDLEEEVKILGYVSWAKLWYRMSGTETYYEIKDDHAVMDMLALIGEHSIINVYVDGGITMDDIIENDVNFGGGNDELNKNDSERSAYGKSAYDGEDEYECGDKDDVERPTKGNDDDIWSDESSEEDYIPSDSDLFDVSLQDLDYISDEEYTQARINLRKRKDVFEVIDCYDGFEFDLGGANVSEYEESDGDVRSYYTDEEEDGLKHRRVRVVYDPKCNHKELKIVLGMCFEDGIQCRKGLTNWAIETGRFIRFRGVTKKKLVAICKPPCPWKVYGSIVEASNTFMIKSYGGDHDCPKSMRNKLVSSKWIANRYLNVFRVRYNLSVKDLRADIMHRFKTDVTKDRLYKAKKIAQDIVRGSVESHYASIPKYIAELRRVDSEGRYELLLGDGGVFKGLYIGLSALRKAFKMSCRPIIGLDGCFLKTYLKGMLLCATGKDGNNGMFPIAWAVVEIENEACWSWFLKCLLEDLQIGDGTGWTFVSDQQKGLENALRLLAPQSEHRNCARHVFMNWKKLHKGETLQNLFWRAVYCTYEEDFKLAIQDFKAENARACEDFMVRNYKRFCKAFISTSACSDSVNNNISETFNGYILNARGKHIIHMLEEIRRSLMVRQVEKFKAMSTVSDSLCPNIRKHLEDLRMESADCTPYPGLDKKFEVHFEGDQFAVHVDAHTCSCRLWDISGIPCKHAISAIQFMEEDPAAYVNDYYSVRRYLSGYEFGIEPIRGHKMWPEVDGITVLPPSLRQMPGRPKKKRIRAPEEREAGRKLSKHGGLITCSKCQQKGHNSRGCKNEAVDKGPLHKKKRGRPAKPHAPSQPNARSAPSKFKGRFAPSTSSSARSTNFKERAIAKTRIGFYGSGATGNVYFHPSTRNQRVAHMNKFKTPRPGASSSKGQPSVVTQFPTTQESGNVDGQ